MPIHDWTRVGPGIFHAFHHRWIAGLSDSLNAGLLPTNYYALPEQVAGGLGPDILTLQTPGTGKGDPAHPSGGVAVATAPPKVWLRTRAELDVYAAKAKAVVIRHASQHQVVAIVEIVSPGNKRTRHAVRRFAEKAEEILRAGVHLTIIDLFPAGPRDPQGLHKEIWAQGIDEDFALPPGKPLTLASYTGGTLPEAFVEPTAVGSTLADMPLFLTPEVYVPLPLEVTYTAAFEAMPAYWRDVLERKD